MAMKPHTSMSAVELFNGAAAGKVLPVFVVNRLHRWAGNPVKHQKIAGATYEL